GGFLRSARNAVWRNPFNGPLRKAPNGVLRKPPSHWFVSAVVSPAAIWSARSWMSSALPPGGEDEATARADVLARTTVPVSAILLRISLMNWRRSKSLMTDLEQRERLRVC